MNKIMSTFILGYLAIILNGCITDEPPRQLSSEAQYLFTGDNEKAFFRAAYEAMSGAKPSLPVLELDGPVRGYRMTWLYILDHYDTAIRVLHASGIGSDGKRHFGYYPEVSGAGTLIIRGPALDNEIYEKVLNRFSKIGDRMLVTSLDHEDYRLDKQRWRLDGKPPIRDSHKINLKAPELIINKSYYIKTKLKELKKLQIDGYITSKKYDILKNKYLTLLN